MATVTSSEAFLFGSVGQPNYSAAKAGITALTLSSAAGLSRYGVRTNTICPRVRTAMSADILGEINTGASDLDPLAPERVATLVSYLASPDSDEISRKECPMRSQPMLAEVAPTRVSTGCGGCWCGALWVQVARWC